MPSKLPRINLTLAPDLYETIRQLAQETRQPMAAVITHLLRQQQPTLRQVTQMIQLAKEAPIPLSVRMELGAAEGRASDLTAEAQAALDRAHEALGRMVEEATGAPVRALADTRTRATARRSSPLVINKGARTGAKREHPASKGADDA